MNFKFLNISVQIHPTFWVLFFLFTDIYRDPSFQALILGIIFGFSLLVHEYGHALTAMRFGVQPTITLWALGGQVQYNGKGLTPFQDFIITLNGPLFNGILIGISYSLLQLDIHYYLRYFLTAMAELNILWCLLNLIPVSPLDGGHLVRYLLERKFGYNGYRASGIIGLASVALITPYLFYKGFFFFGALLFFYGLQNIQIFQGLRSGKASPFNTFNKGIEAINNKDNGKAKSVFKKLLKSKDIQIKHSAIESLAKIYYQENENQKSYDLLLKSDHQFLKEGKCLLCKLALDQKNYELITKYSREIYAIEPKFDIAILNSKAFASSKQPALAGAWLVTASQFGESYRDSVNGVLSLQLYDAVRDHEAFKQQVSKIYTAV